MVTVSDRSQRGRLPDIGGRVVDGPGEYEVKGIPITGIALDVPTVASDGRRKTFVYNVTLDGIVVCHLGRLSEPPAGSGLQEIGQPDVLLIPLGEPDGLAATRAVLLASQLEAKLLVPLTLGNPGDSAALDAFCRELGADPNAVSARATATTTSLAAGTRVALLSRQDGG